MGVIAAACLAGLPAAAGAAELERFGQYGENISYRAAPGEANDLTITWGPGEVTLRDTGAPQIELMASTCRQTGDPHTVVCDDTAPSFRRGGTTAASLGDLDDTARIVSRPGMVSGAGLSGGEGEDTLIGGSDEDRYNGGPGRDTYVVGDGEGDVLSYAGASGVTVDRRVPGAAPDSELIPAAIRTIEGSDGDDVLIGDDGDEVLRGTRGADTLRGSGGDDRLEGHRDYGAADSANTLDGGAGDDDLIGASSGDTLAGGPGDDRLDGWAGPDVFAGGEGFDVATYVEAPAPVAVSIGNGPDDGSAQDGPAGARDDVQTDVEAVRGTDGADTLTGNAEPNVLDGGRGADRLMGADDADVLIGTSGGDDDGVRAEGNGGDDAIGVEGWSAVADGGDGNDVVGFQQLSPARYARVNGGFGNDRLYGGGATAALDAGPGDDLLALRDDVPDSGTCGDGDDVGLIDNDPEWHMTDPVSDCESVPAHQPVISTLRVALAEAGQSTASNGLGQAGVQVTTPRAGALVLEQVGQAEPTPGSAVLPVQMDIRAPQPHPGERLGLRFTFADWIVPAGADLDRIEVRRDGVAVPDCGASQPDPCIASRSRDDRDPTYTNPYAPESDWYTTLVVQSSAGGRWTFGVPSGFSPVAVPDPATQGPPAGDPSDRTAPRVRILGLGTPRLRSVVKQGIRVPLRCSERCETTTQLVLTRSTAKKLRLPTVIGRLKASVNGSKVVRVKVSRSAARRLRRAKALSLTVKTGATDRAGNRSRTVSSKLRLR